MFRTLCCLVLLALLAPVFTAGEPNIARASDERVEQVEQPAAGAVLARDMGSEGMDTADLDETPSFGVELATRSTRYASYGRLRNRAHNVELAASRLDGVVLEPGAVLSFNEVVGERSGEAGFRAAPVIASGRIRQGMGGGVCQVSGTLHAAALDAGLDVVEHRTHSRPSSYIAAGLDATVVWGRIDFKVANPHPFPIRVHAETAEGRMVIRLEGAETVGEFQVRTERLRVLSAPEQVVEDPTLAAGERVVESAGRDGQVVRVIRTDAEGNRDVSRARYAPAPQVVRVGVATAG